MNSSQTCTSADRKSQLEIVAFRYISWIQLLKPCHFKCEFW